MHYEKTLALLCIALASLFINGCKRCGPAEKPTSQYEENMKLSTFAYDCDQEQKWNWVVSFDEGDDTMTLFAPDKTMKLRRLISGSGARYGNEDESVVFWSKGDGATIEMDGRTMRCRENRRRSWIEQAKLQGFDFYGVGNEPGWQLKLGGERVVFVTDYGNQRFVFGRPKMKEEKAKLMTTYRAAEGGHRIDVVLRGTECADSMSGEKFETTVLVVFDGKPLPGCGTPLH